MIDLSVSLYACIVLLLPARAHSEHEAGVGQVLCVDDPPLQLIPTRSTLAFFVVLNAGSMTEAKESISNARLFRPAFLLRSVTEVVGH